MSPDIFLRFKTIYIIIMKQIKKIKRLAVVALISLFTSNLFAQKIEFETIEINYGNIAGGVKKKNEFLVFTGPTPLTIHSGISLNKNNGDYKGKLTLIGKDRKGKRLSIMTDLTYSASGYRNTSKLDIKPEQDNEIYINEIMISVTDSKNNTTSATEPIFNARPNTSFAVLLNGIPSDKFCDEQKLNAVFMNQSVGFGIFAVVLGLNTTKKEPSPIEKAMTAGRGYGIGRYVWTTSHDQRTTRIVTPTTDNAGNWTFEDKMPIKDEKNPPVLESFEMMYITACNDTYTYKSVFMQKLADIKPWDYKVKMDNVIASDNPIFQSGGGGMTNVLGLTFPSSSVTITGGSIAIADHSKFSIGLSNTNVGNGGFNYKKINDVFIALQYNSKGDKINYHWGSAFSKTTPQIVINTDSLKIKELTFTNTEILVVNHKYDTLVYKSNGKFALSLDGKETYLLLEKVEKIKLVKENYTFGKSSLKVTDMKTLSAMTFNFSLKKGSSIPASMTALVEINTCKTDPEFIAVKLKYDPISGLWTGGQSILQTAECPVSVKGFKINIINTCGITYTAKNGYFDETKNTWVCEDECLKVNTDTFCGSTDHF